MNKPPQQLILDHWAYVESVLRAHSIDEPTIEIAKFHYMSAFAHGWKHAFEYEREVDE